ncbi:MAG: hypothetical protein H0T45_00560 [Pyrinomonadaceae bacterium]|nr:hypothetical protein [Pyrinomonadaceae bacterium]
MSLRWQISAGQLFETFRPAAFLLAALVSTWTLADARRRKLKTYAVALWTIGTLAFPFIAFPLYLLARLMGAQAAHWPEHSHADINSSPISSNTFATTIIEAGENSDATAALNEGHAPVVAEAGGTPALPGNDAPPKATPFLWRNVTIPFGYLAILLALAAIFFYRDYHSLDAHLARASHARLHGQRARAVSEYRAALRLRDDPHTRKLLGLELAADRQWDQSLTELRSAEQGGEPDEALPYHLATTLDALGRADEAITEYRKFLQSELCAARLLPDPRCAASRLRVQQGQ